MANENHMGKAGQTIAKGVTNAVNKTVEGRMVDASESAVEGTADAAREVGKSTMQTAQFLTGTQRDKE